MMVVDVYGTADEDRFWDKAEYDEGEFVDLSKEYVRQYYRKTGYKDQLSMGLEMPAKPRAVDTGSASGRSGRDKQESSSNSMR